MPRIIIDAERCSGHGRCYSLAPELFEDDEEGHGRVLQVELDESLLAKAHSAEANCPEGAIRVER